MITGSDRIAAGKTRSVSQGAVVNSGVPENSLDRLIEALMRQQEALLSRDTTVLKEATGSLETTLRGLEGDLVNPPVREVDMERILQAQAISEVNSHLLASWNEWALQVADTLQAQRVDFFDAAC